MRLPLTLTLSHPMGRGNLDLRAGTSHGMVDWTRAPETSSFSPSEGEKAGMRGFLDQVGWLTQVTPED